MTKIHFSLLDLNIVQATTLCAGFMALSQVSLRASSGFVPQNVHHFNLVANWATFWFPCCITAQFESFHFCFSRADWILQPPTLYNWHRGFHCILSITRLCWVFSSYSISDACPACTCYMVSLFSVFDFW